jgi:hypothetical protein
MDNMKKSKFKDAMTALLIIAIVAKTLDFKNPGLLDYAVIILFVIYIIVTIVDFVRKEK